MKAIDKTSLSDDINRRTLDLRSMIRIVIYTWVSRGLFVRHKLLFQALLTFRLMQKNIIDEKYNDKKVN